MSDIEVQRSQAQGSVKKAEQDAFLDSLRKKSEQQKIQQEQQRQKVQEFHLQDQQHHDVAKTQNQIEFKALEQAAKLLNLQPDQLQVHNIKEVLALLQKNEAETLQKIIESQTLQDIQKKFKDAKLEQQGIKQKFSGEMQLLQTIAKALKVPVEQITQGQIQSYLKQNKSESFVPRVRPGTSVSKMESEGTSRVAMRLSQIQGLLESLSAKQEEILRQMGQQKGLKRELDKVTAQIAKLDVKLNQLRDELQQRPNVSAEDQTQDRVGLQDVAQVKRNIQEMREKGVVLKDEPLSIDEDIQKTESDIHDLRQVQTTLQKQLYDSRELRGDGAKHANLDDEAAHSALLEQLNISSDDPTGVSVSKLKDLLDLPVSFLSQNQLAKLKQIIDANQPLLEELNNHVDSMPEMPTDLGPKSIRQWLLEVAKKDDTSTRTQDHGDASGLEPPTKHPDVASLINQASVSGDKKTKDDFKTRVSEWVDRFESAAKEGEESLAPMIIELRKGCLDKPPEFNAIIKQLISKQLMTAEELNQDLGLVLGETDSNSQHSPLKPEAIHSMLRMLNISPNTPTEELPPVVQSWIGKERVSRQDFEVLHKTKISSMAWDYGFIRFNEGSVGLLKERADLNSFAEFEAWMSQLSGGDQEFAGALKDIFFTKDTFTVFERDLGSLFLSEYEDFLIDPNHPFHDLYVQYLSERTFQQLGDKIREELVVGTLLRLISSIESETPNVAFKQLLSLALKPQKSPSFQRFLHLIDYVFSEGGRIKLAFLDINKPLQFVHEKGVWSEEDEQRVAMYTISEVVKGMSMPVKATPTIKLRSLGDRLKEQIKK